MTSLSRTIYLESEVGVERSLSASGTSLENPYVYDSVARELKSMASQGLLEVRGESRREDLADSLIERISFKRLR